MTRVQRLLGALLLALFSSALGLGLVLWWLSRRKSGVSEPVAFEIPIPPAPPVMEPFGSETDDAAAEEPQAAAEEEAEPDDLRRIGGIGPKIASVLQGAGIRTFAQLAEAGASRIGEILEATDPRLRRLADPSTWPEQAGLAAAGDWEALAALQQQLKGGRRARAG